MKHVIIVLTTLALLVAPSAAATIAGTTITVLQLNICHGGMAGCYRGEAVMVKASEVIRQTKPQVLSVNEACSGDIDRLRPAMGPSRALFAPARNLDDTPVICRGGDEYGNIIMVSTQFPGTTNESGSYTAQYRASDGIGEQRSWACLPGPKLSACTTHLSSDNDPTALAQCQDLMRRAATYPRPTIVAGDFNLEDHGSSPNMQDCDPTGFSRRGDGNVQHIYTSTDLTLLTTTEIDMQGTTDHPAWLLTMANP